MISENRDILIERLEQKLLAKERENEELRDSLKESIISELRDGMKDDLDFDKRITIIEKKVKEMSLAYEGVMKELLDQKMIIQDIKHKNIEKQLPAKPEDKPKTISDWHDEVKIRDTEDDHPKVEKITSKESQFIIAESDEPSVSKHKKEKKSDIIIAEPKKSKGSNKGEVIVEAREDEDVVIEYKK